MEPLRRARFNMKHAISGGMEPPSYFGGVNSTVQTHNRFQGESEQQSLSASTEGGFRYENDYLLIYGQQRRLGFRRSWKIPPDTPACSTHQRHRLSCPISTTAAFHTRCVTWRPPSSVTTLPDPYGPGGPVCNSETWVTGREQERYIHWEIQTAICSHLSA